MPPGDKPLSEPTMVSLLIHMNVSFGLNDSASVITKLLKSQIKIMSLYSVKNSYTSKAGLYIEICLYSVGDGKAQCSLYVFQGSMFCPWCKHTSTVSDTGNLCVLDCFTVTACCLQGWGLLSEIYSNKFHVRYQGFSNMASDWLVAVLPANQMPGLKIFGD